MTKNYLGETVYTANDEEPKCNRCDFICSSNDLCDKCGPEYGWFNYRRSVPIDDLDILLDQLLKD